LKQGNILSPIPLNFALEYGIRNIQENQEGLESNGTNKLLLCSKGITYMGRKLKQHKGRQRRTLRGYKGGESKSKPTENLQRRNHFEDVDVRR